MPVTKNIDMKLQFEPYDCTPGPNARTFLRKCLQHGAKTDDQGWSLQDTFMRLDDGAVQNGTGIGIPGTPVTSWGMKGMLKCYQIGNLAGPGA